MLTCDGRRYDVDGDGVVSTRDLYMASKFDVNGDGILQEDEQVELRKQMVADVLERYDDQPHAGATNKVRRIVDEFRARPGVDVVSDSHFTKKMTTLQVNLVSQNGQDSRQMYQSLMARRIPEHFNHVSVEQTFQEHVAFAKKYSL
jgi:hypothetical protein